MGTTVPDIPESMPIFIRFSPSPTHVRSSPSRDAAKALAWVAVVCSGCAQEGDVHHGREARLVAVTAVSAAAPSRRPAFAEEDAAAAVVGPEQELDVATRDALRQELVEMGRADLRENRRAVELAFAGLGQPTLTLARAERLAQIIDQVGWPGIALVGEDGAAAAFLIAQHADHDPEFQMRCAELINGAFARGDAQARHAAYLSDRAGIIDEQGLQLFGTQGGHGYTAEQEATIDARRVAMGMETLAESRVHYVGPGIGF
jgi:hypothetical protein